MPSTEMTKGVKLRLCSRHFLAYFFFFSSSWISIASKGVLGRCDGWSVSVKRTSITQSVPVFQKPLTRRSPRSSDGSSGVGADGFEVEVVELLGVVESVVPFVDCLL